MRRYHWHVSATRLALSCIVVLSLHRTSAAADSVVGKEIAQRWCTSCHLINGKSGPDGAPPFPAIADHPDMTSDRIAAFLTQPHGGMPDLALTQGEIDDLDAYIRTLRQR